MYIVLEKIKFKEEKLKLCILKFLKKSLQRWCNWDILKKDGKDVHLIFSSLKLYKSILDYYYAEALCFFRDIYNTI